MDAHGGRPRHKFWEDGNFEGLSGNRAKCLFCNKIYQNTAQERLKKHRLICKDPCISSLAEQITSHEGGGNYSIDEDSMEPELSKNRTNSLETNKEVSSRALQTSKSRKRKMDNFIDSISAKDQLKIDLALAKLIYKWNIDFEVVNCSYFHEFVGQLRPAYKVPTINALATTLLHTVHESVQESQRKIVASDCVLITLNLPTATEASDQIIGILETCQHERIFLKSWDVSHEQQFETLEDIIVEAIEITKNKYNMQIYAVLLGNKEMIQNLVKDSNLFYFVEQNSLIEFTANALEDSSLINELEDLLGEFDTSILKEEIEERGGDVLIFNANASWELKERMYSSYLTNLPILKLFVADNLVKMNDKTSKLFNSEFGERVKKHQNVLNALSLLSSKCQDPTSNLADVAEEWVLFEEIHGDCFNDSFSVKEVLSPPLLAANFLHHKYRGIMFKDKDSQEAEINSFLLDVMCEEGLDGYEAFKSQRGIFGKLLKKELKAWKIFWNVATSEFPKLSHFVRKLLSIPVVASKLHFDLIPQRNLTPNRYQKLVDIHHHLKIDNKKADNT